MKEYLERKKILAMLWGVSLTMSSGTVLAACVPGDCSGLGYTKSASDCSGVDYVRCPFDTSKYYCVKPAAVCEYSNTESTCSAQCKEVGTVSCTASDGSLRYQSCGISKCGSYGICTNGRCTCRYGTYLTYRDNSLISSEAPITDYMQAEFGNTVNAPYKIYFYEDDGYGTSAYLYVGEGPVFNNSSDQSSLRIACKGEGVLDSSTKSCSTGKNTARFNFYCYYYSYGDLVKIHFGNVLDMTSAQIQNITRDKIKSICEKYIEKDKNCAGVNFNKVTAEDFN